MYKPHESASAKNKNSVNSLGVPTFVDPINDPPYMSPLLHHIEE